jgi:hypothetical protein
LLYLIGEKVVCELIDGMKEIHLIPTSDITILQKSSSTQSIDLLRRSEGEFYQVDVTSEVKIVIDFTSGGRRLDQYIDKVRLLEFSYLLSLCSCMFT